MDDRWLAGLMEGEASFRLGKVGKTETTQRVGIQVNMTDEDVIRSVHRVAGVGNVTGPYVPDNPKWSPQWHWRVGNREDVRHVLERILPYMHSRRAAKIQAMLEVIDEVERKGKYPRGVSSNRSGRYQAYIGKDGVRRFLGSFDTAKQAKAAYDAARKA